MVLKEWYPNCVFAVGHKMVRKSGKILPSMFQILCFSDGVIECILWKVLKFVSFCIGFAKSLGLGCK